MVKDYSLGGKIPEIEKKINTDQFKISEEILDVRFEKGLSFDEVAQVVGMPREKYIKFEYGDNDLGLPEYYEVLHKLREYKSKPSVSNIQSDSKINCEKKVDEAVFKVGSNYTFRNVDILSSTPESTNVFTNLVPDTNRHQRPYKNCTVFNSKDVEKKFTFVKIQLENLNDVNFSLKEKRKEGTAA